MEINKIYNEDCFLTMTKMKDAKLSVDTILTSPFYNTNKKAGSSRTLKNTTVKEGQYNYVRYDVHIDDMTNDEYCEYTVNLFNKFDEVLAEDGVVLYNLSYGSQNTDGMFRAVNDVIMETNFTLADTIIWKKSNAFPNSSSPNKLTRIVEYVFVFVRKSEFMTFNSNKEITSVRETGQRMYENITNFIDARNNDGACPYNKATYSSELCVKLLKIYAPNNSLVFDPFMGSGTTAVACKELGLSFIGSEISVNQCEWAEDRLERCSKEVS